MRNIKDWYLGGMVEAADKAEFKEDEHPRGKGGMFVKKGEGGGSDGVAGKVEAYRKKHEAFSKELLKDLNSQVAEKMRGELQSMLSELDGMGVDVERLGVGKDDKIPMKAGKGVDITEGDIVAYVGKTVEGKKHKPLGVVVRVDTENGKKFYTADFNGNLSKVPASDIRAATKEESDSASEATIAFSEKVKRGGSSSALEEVYKKGGFKHPEALAKADFEELGKMSDSRLDAEITMLKGRVEESGKPLDKARLEVAKGIMDGRK